MILKGLLKSKAGYLIEEMFLDSFLKPNDHAANCMRGPDWCWLNGRHWAHSSCSSIMDQLAERPLCVYGWEWRGYIEGRTLTNQFQIKMLLHHFKSHHVVWQEQSEFVFQYKHHNPEVDSSADANVKALIFTLVTLSSYQLLMSLNWIVCMLNSYSPFTLGIKVQWGWVIQIRKNAF